MICPLNKRLVVWVRRRGERGGDGEEGMLAWQLLIKYQDPRSNLI